MPMLHNCLQDDLIVHNWHLALICSKISFSWMLKCKDMTIAISMLKNISLQNYHLKRPNKLLQMSFLYTNSHSKKLLMLTNSII